MGRQATQTRARSRCLPMDCSALWVTQLTHYGLLFVTSFPMRRLPTTSATRCESLVKVRSARPSLARPGTSRTSKAVPISYTSVSTSAGTWTACQYTHSSFHFETRLMFLSQILPASPALPDPSLPPQSCRGWHRDVASKLRVEDPAAFETLVITPVVFHCYISDTICTTPTLRFRCLASALPPLASIVEFNNFLPPFKRAGSLLRPHWRTRHISISTPSRSRAMRCC